jgi:hypothetical protein
LAMHLAIWAKQCHKPSIWMVYRTHLWILKWWFGGIVYEHVLPTLEYDECGSFFFKLTKMGISLKIPYSIYSRNSRMIIYRSIFYGSLCKYLFNWWDLM